MFTQTAGEHCPLCQGNLKAHSPGRKRQNDTVTQTVKCRDCDTNFRENYTITEGDHIKDKCPRCGLPPAWPPDCSALSDKVIAMYCECIRCEQHWSHYFLLTETTRVHERTP